MASGLGIEDKILSDIEENTGVSFDDDGMDDAVDQPGQQDQQDQLSQQMQRRQVQDPNAEVDLQNPLEQPKAKGAKGKEQRQVLRPNKDGDIVDGQGNVVASRGRERRLHVQLERTRDLVKVLEERNAALARNAGDSQYLGGLPAKLGLHNDEVSDALGIVAKFKTDPIGAARDVIERAIAAGASLHQIVDDQFIPNVTVAATQRLLDERLGPLSRNLKEQESVGRINQEAAEKGNRFLSEYPDAVHHQDVVADQMKHIMESYEARGLKMDPFVAAEKAFGNVLSFAEKHGFDISQPLGPQIQARVQGQQGGNQRRQSPGRVQPTQTARRPLPPGNGGMGSPMQSTKSRSANADESYDSIVREAMRESGYNF